MTGPQAHRQQAQNQYTEFISLVQASCDVTEQHILELLEDCPLLDNNELGVEDAAQEAIEILINQGHRIPIWLRR